MFWLNFIKFSTAELASRLLWLRQSSHENFTKFSQNYYYEIISRII